MGLRDLFGKKEQDRAPDPIADLGPQQAQGRLSGGLRSEDLGSDGLLPVRIRRRPRGGVGDHGGGREKRYLELADERWSLAEKIVIGVIEGDIRSQILREEDPPSRIVHKGTQYYLDNSCAGYMFPNGEGKGEEVIRWGVFWTRTRSDSWASSGGARPSSAPRRVFSWRTTSSPTSSLAAAPSDVLPRMGASLLD